MFRGPWVSEVPWALLQVHEKEDVELDVLSSKSKEVAVGKDQGHIIDLGAPPAEKKESGQRRKAKASPSAGMHMLS